jgi:hypothetical protein
MIEGEQFGVWPPQEFMRSEERDDLSDGEKRTNKL